MPEAENENRLRVLDAKGMPVTETGAAPDFLGHHASAPVVVAGSALGRVEASASLDKSLLETGVVAVLSGLLGFRHVLHPAPPADPGHRQDDRRIGVPDAAFRDGARQHGKGALHVRRRATASRGQQTLPRVVRLAADQIVLGMTEPELQALSPGARTGPESDVAGEWATYDGALLHLANGAVIAGFRRPMADGGRGRHLRGCDERTVAEERIFHMSRHDPLTELPNRRLFHEELDSALKHADADESVTVLYLGIDDFKNVNDALGHPIGDRLLKQIAARLRGTVRTSDTVARLGGDEFAMILSRLPPFDAAALAVRIVELIGEPYVVDGQQVVVGTSIGIAVSPNDGNATDDLLKNADLALQLAKAEGRGTHRYFEPDMDARVKQRHGMKMELRRAVAMEEFELFYQPVLNAASEEIVGLRGAVALEPSRTRPGVAGRVHPDCRRDRTDRRHRRMGDPHGLPRGRHLAGGPHGRGQPVADPVQEREPHGRDQGGAGGVGTAGRPPRARGHRDRHAAG